jgi:hypothetical protein
MRFCLFLHFSIACAIEKWRHIPVPQEALPFAEIPMLNKAAGLTEPGPSISSDRREEDQGQCLPFRCNLCFGCEM